LIEPCCNHLGVIYVAKEKLCYEKEDCRKGAAKAIWNHWALRGQETGGASAPPVSVVVPCQVFSIIPQTLNGIDALSALVDGFPHVIWERVKISIRFAVLLDQAVQILIMLHKVLLSSDSMNRFNQNKNRGKGHVKGIFSLPDRFSPTSSKSVV
jgi:hypothetical protein